MKDKFTKIFLWLVVIFLTMSFVRSIIKVREVNRRISQKKAQLAKIEKQNEELKKKVEEITGEYNIERELRDSLGLAKTGEVVVVLPPDEVLETLVPKVPSGEEDALPAPIWQQWLGLFI